MRTQSLIQAVRTAGVLLFSLHAMVAQAASLENLNFRYDAPAEVKSVCLAADFLSWDTEKLCFKKQNAQSQTFTLEIPRPWATSVQYKFVIDGKYWIQDPLNPSRISDGHGGSNSYLEDTGFRDDPLLTLKPGNQAWKRRKLTLAYEATPGSETQATGLASSRDIVVVFPASQWLQRNRYEKGEVRPQVTVYFQDGLDYLNQAGAAALLANLSQMPGMPIYTGVFIPPMDRTSEYGITPATLDYERFLIEQVIPAVEQKWSTGGRRENRILMGPSLGGLVTFHLALRNPKIFGHAVSQSGSFWYRDKESTELIEKAPDLVSAAPQLFLEVGIWESTQMVEWNRKVKALLEAKGVAIHYREYPTSHRWSAWKNRLSEILIKLAQSSPNSRSTP